MRLASSPTLRVILVPGKDPMRDERARGRVVGILLAARGASRTVDGSMEPGTEPKMPATERENP